ncbi:hypothetical protein K9L67_02590 [Candidatus Woesearchaeota archaeon]|nr:hypothetical protein [Candidatus Woesearchaeota archaeon]MCF7901093.1 hypothetical protein [Candidatus Woesearchaeota archaeon]MCF8013426.1 hypothetical protein [Candidatus Woesearchaeota archaeon]
MSKIRGVRATNVVANTISISDILTESDIFLRYSYFPLSTSIVADVNCSCGKDYSKKIINLYLKKEDLVNFKCSSCKNPNILYIKSKF